MRDVVQWRLRDSDLRLTVSEEIALEINSLISDTQVNPASMCGAKAHAIIADWCLTVCEEGTLLTNHVNQCTCLVASFPTPSPASPLPVHHLSGFSLGDIVEVNFEGEWF